MLGGCVSSELPAREQAGAALANACANCYENQIAARHAGAVHVLVEELQLQRSPSLLECSLCAIRNLCINSLENQEEISRCNGMIPLLKLLHSCMRHEILEVVASTIVKVCLYEWGGVGSQRQLAPHSSIAQDPSVRYPLPVWPWWVTPDGPTACRFRALRGIHTPLLACMALRCVWLPYALSLCESRDGASHWRRLLLTLPCARMS